MIAVHYPVTDSTSTRAARLAEINPGSPVLVSAWSQTAGRGRTGRTWHSPAGGAWFSLAFPAPAAPIHMEPAPLVAGLAVRAVLQELLPPEEREDLLLKWPNDLLLRGRKLAGILCERTLLASAGADGGIPAYSIIVGVGINANNDTRSLRDLRQAPISLREATGAAVEVPRLVVAAGRRIESAFHRLAREGLTVEDVAALDAALAWRGEWVSLRHGDAVIGGILRGVDARGRLLLEVDGVSHAFSAGEVSQLQPLPAHAAACV